MNFKNGFSLFTKTSSKYTFNIASYHPKISITWLWCLSITRPREWCWGRFIKSWGIYKGGAYGYYNYNISTPFFHIQLTTQEKMPYK